MHPSSGLLPHRCGEVIYTLASLPFNLPSFSLGFLCVTHGSRRKISTFPADKSHITERATVEILVGFEGTVDISRDSCRIMTMLRMECRELLGDLSARIYFYLARWTINESPFIKCRFSLMLPGAATGTASVT